MLRVMTQALGNMVTMHPKNQAIVWELGLHKGAASLFPVNATIYLICNKIIALIGVSA
jgi:hypothetical protein